MRELAFQVFLVDVEALIEEIYKPRRKGSTSLLCAVTLPFLMIAPILSVEA